MTRNTLISSMKFERNAIEWFMLRLFYKKGMSRNYFYSSCFLDNSPKFDFRFRNLWIYEENGHIFPQLSIFIRSSNKDFMESYPLTADFRPFLLNASRMKIPLSLGRSLSFIHYFWRRVSWILVINYSAIDRQTSM